jgi:hypothetical protein
VDGVDDLGVVDALQLDPAPRGAVRKEMTDDNISSVSTGMPAPGRCSGSEKLGVHLGRGIARVGVKRPRRCDGRAGLPDARVRASETERQSGSELVSEAPRLQRRPETWRTWVVDGDDAALIYGGSLHVWVIYLGVVAGERLRVLAGCAVPLSRSQHPLAVGGHRNRPSHCAAGNRRRMTTASRSATTCPAESRMPGNGHVRFGGRVGETDRR